MRIFEYIIAILVLVGSLAIQRHFHKIEMNRFLERYRSIESSKSDMKYLSEKYFECHSRLDLALRKVFIIEQNPVHARKIRKLISERNKRYKNAGIGGN